MSALPQLRAHRRCWLLLALPALVLRALIPTGFMPVATELGLNLELCPDAAVLPPGLVAAAVHAHHHHQHFGHGVPEPASATHHAPCLFAASATLAPAPSAVLMLRPQPAGSDVSGQAPAVRTFVPSILRAQSARSPPPGRS